MTAGSGARKRRAYSSEAAICRADTCGEPSVTVGWCHAHYQRVRLGKPMAPPVRVRRHEIPPVRLLPRITG